ncbi:hypothetical protein GCM10010441_31550 [Kitasatospora paracochleata]
MQAPSALAAAAEEAAAEPAERCHQRDADATASRGGRTGTGGAGGGRTSRRQLPYQAECFGRVDRRDGGRAEDSEVPLDPAAGRTDAALDRRYAGPCPHFHVFHQFSHPYEAPGP